MKLDFNLQVTQKQGIALTAQVQQAIKLLHMTNMEIQEYVDDKFQDNPFIETTGEFEEQKQSEITKNNRADIDKSLDNNTVDKMLSNIINEELFSNLCIIIVSHNIHNTELFTKLINVENNNDILKLIHKKGASHTIFDSKYIIVLPIYFNFSICSATNCIYRIKC